MEGILISNKYKDEYNIYDKIIETKEEVEKIKRYKINYLAYIHCNNCFRKCPLSNPNCGRGKKLSERI